MYVATDRSALDKGVKRDVGVGVLLRVKRRKCQASERKREEKLGMRENLLIYSVCSDRQECGGYGGTEM